RVVPAHPGLPHRLLHPVRVAERAELGRRVLQPRSEWKITPATLPPRVATAIRSASHTSSARRCVAKAQPMTRRENTSRTVARYSQPSHVRTYVMSPTQSPSGAGAVVDSPFTRSGLAG